MVLSSAPSSRGGTPPAAAAAAQMPPGALMHDIAPQERLLVNAIEAAVRASRPEPRVHPLALLSFVLRPLALRPLVMLPLALVPFALVLLAHVSLALVPLRSLLPRARIRAGGGATLRRPGYYA